MFTNTGQGKLNTEDGSLQQEVFKTNTDKANQACGHPIRYLRYTIKVLRRKL